MNKLLRLVFIFFCFQLSNSWALAPLESFVLGNFKENYSEKITDPLNYVFVRDKNQKTNDTTFKRELALYRGFYEEGKNLDNYCKGASEVHYATEWDKIQVKRGILSEMQYIGLDLLSRALPQYAKELEFSSTEYSNMVENLVGNYCSSNISVISKKELKNNLMVKFSKDNTFRLPSVEGNPFFPENLENYSPKRNQLEQEFKYSIKLFQTLCSWGGNPDSLTLLVPLLKNPALMAFIFRQLNNEVIDWKPSANALYLKEDLNTVQVLCDNLICRKTTHDNFKIKSIKAVGSNNLAEDFKKLYCEDFKTADYKTKDLDPRLAKMIRSVTFDEENFLNSQFISLITGVPDFLLRVDKFSKGEDMFRASVDSTWTKWAKAQTEILNTELFFEEPLTIELVSHSYFFNPLKPKYRVAFDINLGEFDRVNERNGKVRVGFNLNVQRPFLNYFRSALSNLGPNDLNERTRLIKRFKLQLMRDVANAREKFIIPPWKGDLEALIAAEITSQIEEVANKNFKIPSTGIEVIPVELNYGIFALKYINHQKITLKNSEIKSLKESANDKDKVIK
jgi:hypothetical protein